MEMQELLSLDAFVPIAALRCDGDGDGEGDGSGGCGAGAGECGEGDCGDE